MIADLEAPMISPPTKPRSAFACIAGCMLVLLTAGHLQAETFYLSKQGDNSTGASWSTAWNECDQIQWSVVQPGDTIAIDGGSAGMTYATGLTVGKAGTSAQRISIVRSEEAGHDGPVTLRGVDVQVPYVTIDGKDRYRFLIQAEPPATGYVVYVVGDGDHFELRNAYLRGDYSGEWGSLFYVGSPPKTVLVKGCGFFQSNMEDQLRFDCPNGTLVVEDSYFSDLEESGAHNDAVQFYAAGINFTVRRSMFHNVVSTFMLANIGSQGDLLFESNVFISAGDAIKIDAATDLKILNNLFYACRSLILYDSAPTLSRNNIYGGTGPWDGTVYTGSGDQHSLWDIGTTVFEPGTGNVQADPLWVDEENPLGPDGLPFTSDDGFMITADSPARDAGVAVGLTVDILGHPLSGTPDIGPYEYQSGVIDTVGPKAPQNLQVL
jgi:hypothetical protein